jgi:hypothetical protein
MSTLGKETVVTVNGKPWTFGRLDRRVLEDFFAFVRDQEGDPFEDFARFKDSLSEADRLAVFRECQAVKRELKSLNWNSPTVQRHLDTRAGERTIATMLLRPAHPTITEDEALAVLESLPAAEIKRIMANSFGKTPGKNEDSPAA